MDFHEKKKIFKNKKYYTKKEKLADEIERGFFLLGATAVEDKL